MKFKSWWEYRQQEVDVPDGVYIDLDVEDE